MADNVIKFKVNTILMKILIGLIMAVGGMSGFIISDFYRTISDLKTENDEYDKELADIKIQQMHIMDQLDYMMNNHNKWGHK